MFPFKLQFQFKVKVIIISYGSTLTAIFIRLALD